MLDIKKVKQMLENGEEVRLECVDKSELLNWHKEANKALLNSELIVKSVEDNVILIKDCSFNIVPVELKYFRIAEDKPTFDDLISAVIKAVEDSVLVVNRFDSNRLYALSVDGNGSIEVFRDKYSAEEINNNINFINSLYTETFVIEQDGDIQKLKGEPNISLANGNEFVAKKMKIGSNSRGMFAIGFIDVDGYEMTYSFFELKGATVTQKRGK